jgi:Cys-rich protein (TIGR01571 family)
MHARHFHTTTKMAQPAVAVAVAVPVTAQAVHVVQIQSGGANANQQWKSELCGCCEDGCTCMAGCCCPCITSVQLAIKVGMTKTTACKSLSAFLFMLYFLAALLYVLGYLMQQCIPIRSSYSGTYYGNVCIPNITLWYFALVRCSRPPPQPANASSPWLLPMI